MGDDSPDTRRHFGSVRFASIDRTPNFRVYRHPAPDIKSLNTGISCFVDAFARLGSGTAKARACREAAEAGDRGEPRLVVRPKIDDGTAPAARNAGSGREPRVARSPRVLDPGATCAGSLIPIKQAFTESAEKDLLQGVISYIQGLLR